LTATLAAFIAIASLPSLASAQGTSAEPVRLPMGERYFIEVSGTLWNPTLAGIISSDRLDVVGDHIDFTNDLGFTSARFRDLRLVLRPAPKHRFRLQYTPVVHTSDTVFQRDIAFGGQTFPVAMPVRTDFGWTVWRVGYEFDFVYKPRGFVGVLFEGRFTQFRAQLSAPIGQSELVEAQAPLPAIGIVGRVYVVPGVAVNFEVTGLRLRNVMSDYDAVYADWDLHGTVNLTNNVGAQVGWRKMTTYLEIGGETGDLKFQGLWFGAAIRY
jgi:hypothetical protein